MKHLKQEFDKLTFKDVLLYSIGLITLIASFVLLFMGMLIPPEGEIHDSVLTAFGLSLFFVASIYGITLYMVDSIATFKRNVMALLAKHNVNTEGLEENSKVNNPDKAK